MCNKMTIDIVTASATSLAVIVALFANWYNNRNNKKQILVGKLEELYSSVFMLNRYYSSFMDLYHRVQDLRSKQSEELKTLSDYYKLRDLRISDRDKQQIESYLMRIEILSKCYTSGDLLKKISEYEILMFSFYELVRDGGSIQQEIHFKNGFPSYEEFYQNTELLKKDIAAKIEL